MEPLLQGFLEYVKDVFGDEITFEKAEDPDSFERFFGQSFLSKQYKITTTTEDYFTPLLQSEYIRKDKLGSKGHAQSELPQREADPFERVSKDALFVTAA